MLEQLKKTFSSFFIFSGNQDIPSGYQWFTTADDEIIGIAKAELTKKDIAILSAFLSPYNIKFPVLNEHEKIWKKRITTNSNNETVPPFRFVFFSIDKSKVDPRSFKEALYELFAKPAPVLWVNEHEGIIIEEQSSLAEENISYEQIIDVLMSDLYVKINFFVGSYVTNLKNLKMHYNSFTESASTVFAYSDKPVVTYVDAITYLLVEQTDPSFRDEIIAIVLQEFATDHELLHTIQTFIHCNLNVTVTAKELYMHRNSLQYRLDKFAEKTGIDVRQFNQAMTVYLALLANMHKDN